MTRTRRWLPFAVVTLATVLLAGGAGLAVDRFATPRAQPAPALKTVSAPMLAKLGITLSAPTEPLYCSVAGAVVSHGWLHSGVASCAISQSAAEAAASLGGGVRVVESVLAQVTSSRVLAVGRDLLAWVVVTQQSFSTPSNCGTINGGSTCASVTWSGFIWNVIVIVDARSGGVVNQQQLNAGRAGPDHARLSAAGDGAHRGLRSAQVLNPPRPKLPLEASTMFIRRVGTRPPPPST